MTLGLIGMGRWGRVYVQALGRLEDVAILTHVCTSNPENSSLLPGGTTVLSRWEDLIAERLDGVIVATPPDVSGEIIMALVDREVACLVEKPLAADLQEVERLHDSIEQAGVPVLVDHTMLFHPAYATLKRRIDEVGAAIRLVLAETTGLGPFRAKVSGLWDWGPHALSVVVDLLGSEPTLTRAAGVARDEHGCTELASLELRFPGGAEALVTIGRMSPVKRRRVTVYTAKNVLELDESNTPPLRECDLDFDARSRADLSKLTMSASEQQTPEASEPPIDRLIRYFVAGLSGGPRDLFGTARSVSIARILTDTEVMLRQS